MYNYATETGAEEYMSMLATKRRIITTALTIRNVFENFTFIFQTFYS